MRVFLIWLWCFPQMLAGFLLRIVTRAKKSGDHYEYNIRGGSVSLGEYIFLSPQNKDDERVLRHEKGHTKQSRMLGWLYLLVIGLPSFIWFTFFKRYRAKHNKDYYSFYTERWADRLAGINRYQE